MLLKRDVIIYYSNSTFIENIISRQLDIIMEQLYKAILSVYITSGINIK
jgi:hypothetical protein